MKYRYQKPDIDIDCMPVLEPLLGSRAQYGGTKDPEDGGKTIPYYVQDTDGSEDPYSNGQGYGTNRSNSGSLWDN